MAREQRLPLSCVRATGRECAPGYVHLGVGGGCSIEALRGGGRGTLSPGRRKIHGGTVRRQKFKASCEKALNMSTRVLCPWEGFLGGHSWLGSDRVRIHC